MSLLLSRYFNNVLIFEIWTIMYRNCTLVFLLHTCPTPRIDLMPLQLSNKCMPELKRTIIAQGESVNLSPAIVSTCAEDLVAYCAGFETNKDDYGCLQVSFGLSLSKFRYLVDKCNRGQTEQYFEYF